MKNSLQLELQLKIKRANRFLNAKQYSQAINAYTQGLQLYQQNRTYNNCVSQQFQALLYSLRANTYSLNLDSQLAQQDFTQSLKINPYSAVTLSRRAKHFMKEKRFSQAIQDIDMALLYDPQNLNYISLLNTIQNYINESNDQQEKKHITSLINQVKNRLQAKPPTQSQSDQQDDQSILNFSKLKQIDRKSVKIVPKLQNRKSIIQFKQDVILQYDKDQQPKQSAQQPQINIRISSAQIQDKIKKQDQQLHQLQQEEQQIRKTEPIKLSQHFILTKTHQKSRKSILRRSSIGNKNDQQLVFLSSPGQKSCFLRKSSISAASIKDIDGKLVKHQGQNIKFRPSFNQIAKFDLGHQDQIPQENQKQNFLTRTTPKLQKRKSCLRTSKRFQADDLEQLSKTAPVIKKRSSFLNIKNIDGEFHPKNQQKLQSSQSQDGIVNVKIQTQSDDDNQHNIFGIKQKQVVQTINNGQQLPQIVTMKLSKKKSILKKDSLIEGSMLGSTLGWKIQKKKSVLFKTG